MLIGIPKEVKDHEYRVGATPDMVKALVAAGHKVMVQTMAGDRIGFTDELYREVGAKIVSTLSEVYQAEMIIKVKEPQSQEFPLLKEGQILFCYLHLAPDPEQTKHLLERKVIGIAYETVTDRENRLPLLIPMSEIAGRISIQAGATALQISNGGKGILLGGVTGVPPAKVTVIGAGIAGTQAARMAMGLGADVTIMDNNLNRLRDLDALFGPRLKQPFLLQLLLRRMSFIRPGDRRRAHPGKNGPKTHHARDSQKDEPRICHRRYRYRSRRLHRNVSSNDAYQSDLRGRWHYPLLRHQYAWRLRQNFYASINKCHDALCAQNCEQGV